MLIRQRKSYELPDFEITPRALYMNRRSFMASAGAAAGALLAGPALLNPAKAEAAPLPKVPLGPYGTTEKMTPYGAVTSYNNYYEFGTGKSDPSENARNFVPGPWTITVDGEVEKPGSYALGDLIKPADLQERVYRMRCVEAWSIVVPWVGFPLAELVKRVEPTSRAKFVVFTTLLDPKQLPGERWPVLSWPYVEGLRIDEAVHPLTLMAVGVYGRVLPGQNGAPLRLVVPWKYGFKGAKSLVSIRFQEQQPRTTWNLMAPNEYGFLANVNPAVDHPRWSQAKERRLGDFFKRPTLPFNGYGDQVASLYAGIDLRKNF